MENASADIARLRASQPMGECILVEGDITRLDLGLSGNEIQQIIDEVQVIHHMAEMFHLGTNRKVIHRVNVEGTRKILGIAAEMKSLRRICHYSTAQVAGTLEGVILEEDLECGQSFHNAYEATKFQAERLVRRVMGRVPVTILRPSIQVGSTRTGMIDRTSGAHLLLAIFINLPSNFPLPLPGKGHFPLNLVPTEYVVEAAYQLSLKEEALGHTFHLTDPNPLSVKGVFDLVSDLAKRRRPLDQAANLLPYRIARTLLRLPILDKRAKGAGNMLDALHSLAIYNRINTDRLLSTHDVQCAPFSSYASQLVEELRTLEGYDIDLNLPDEII
jgi:thioester reductase-like protein